MRLCEKISTFYVLEMQYLTYSSETENVISIHDAFNIENNNSLIIFHWIIEFSNRCIHMELKYNICRTYTNVQTLGRDVGFHCRYFSIASSHVNAKCHRQNGAFLTRLFVLLRLMAWCFHLFAFKRCSALTNSDVSERTRLFNVLN